MAPDSRSMVNLNVRVPPELKERLELVSEYEARAESSFVRPKLMELHRELEDHPAVAESRDAARASR